MERFAATLVAEGTSDQALLPFIDFVLNEHCAFPHVTSYAGDLNGGPLLARIQRALALYPCDLLFVHRDADRTRVSDREQEIQAAALNAGGPFAICVVPVRMTEAWLLTDPLAIRRAAGKPTGTANLGLPALARLEAQANPKSLLFAALEAASELGMNRLRRFDRYRARRQVSNFVEDFSSLRRLPSFRHFESQVRDFFLDFAPATVLTVNPNE
jgi:hypothetical protein